MRKGWVERKIGEFARRVRRLNQDGIDYPPLSVTKDRGIVLQSEKYNKRIATDPRKYLVAHPGEFVYDAMSLYYGAIGRVTQDRPGLVSPDYVLFEVDDSVDHEFLQHVFRSDLLHSTYEMLAEGGNQHGKRRRIYWSVFETIPVRLPPLDEQRRIAAVLSAIDHRISATTTAVETALAFKNALLHHEFQSAEAVALDELNEPARPICYGILMPGQGHPGGVPVVKVKDIKAGEIRADSLLHTSPAIDQQYRRSRLRAGDVLLTIRGTTGRVAMVPPTLHGANITQDTARISITDPALRDWVYYALQSPNVQHQIAENTRGQAVKGINIGDVRTLMIPTPGAAERQRIVALLVAIDRVIRASADEVDAARASKRAVATRLLGASG